MDTNTKTTVTVELLLQFEKLIGTEKERFISIKKEMDNDLEGFLWNDGESQKFKIQYAEGLEPLNRVLLPALETYQKYLTDLANKITTGYAQK